MKSRLLYRYILMNNVSFVSFFLYPLLCAIMSFFLEPDLEVGIIFSYFFFAVFSLIQFFPFLTLSYVLNKRSKKINRFYLWMPLIGSLFIPLLVSGILFGPSHASVEPGYFVTATIAGIISIIYFYYSTYYDDSTQEEEK